VAKGVAADYGAYVETGLARDDEEFAQLYRQAQLSMGSKSFSLALTRNDPGLLTKTDPPCWRCVMHASPAGSRNLRFTFRRLPWSPFSIGV
jgi:hypothetical protein